jgi:hypothetical protein
VIAILVVLVGLLALPMVARWIWHLQLRVVGSLVPGVHVDDVAALADRPLAQRLGAAPPLIAGPTVRLVGVIREAASVLIAYRHVRSDGDPDGPAGDVGTLLFHVDEGGGRALAVLERWREAGTALVMGHSPAGVVAIQHARTRLTVTLPLVA